LPNEIQIHYYHEKEIRIKNSTWLCLKFYQNINKFKMKMNRKYILTARNEDRFTCHVFSPFEVSPRKNEGEKNDSRCNEESKKDNWHHNKSKKTGGDNKKSYGDGGGNNASYNYDGGTEEADYGKGDARCDSQSKDESNHNGKCNDKSNHEGRNTRCNNASNHNRETKYNHDGSCNDRERHLNATVSTIGGGNNSTSLPKHVGVLNLNFFRMLQKIHTSLVSHKK
jgi:hypothetical protein